MAIRQDIIDTPIYVGEDKDLVFTIYQSDNATPQNVAAWAMSFMVKRSASDLDVAAVLTKTTSSGITIEGTYNVDPAVNTQRVRVAIADTDTDAIPHREYIFELKRTDAGQENVLALGNFVLRRGIHRT